MPVFQEFSASISKAFILAGGTGHSCVTLWGLGTFFIFPNFLKSQVLSCSATGEATCKYRVYK